jgi:hypothetical protein
MKCGNDSDEEWKGRSDDSGLNSNVQQPDSGQVLLTCLNQ